RSPPPYPRARRAYYGPTPQLRLVNLHVIEDGPRPRGPAPKAVELPVVRSRTGESGALRHGSERRPFVLRQVERIGHGCCRDATCVVELRTDGSETRRVPGRGVGRERCPRIRRSVVAFVVAGCAIAIEGSVSDHN